jgi:hypothetical protein
VDNSESMMKQCRMAVAEKLKSEMKMEPMR